MTMPTGTTSVERLGRLHTEMSAAGIDLLLATPSADLQYLCGYAGHASERPTLYAVSPGQRPVMILPALEAPRLQGRKDLEVVAYDDGADPYVLIQSSLPVARGQIRIAISDQTWAGMLLKLQSLFPSASFLSAAGLFAQLRIVKTSGELESLSEASKRADQAFEELVQRRFSGRTERDLADELNRLTQQLGLSRASWEPIVASGPNSASPHHISGERQIAGGDAVVLDFGGVFDGYQADITRTVHVGEASREFLEVYELVARAQQAGFEAAVADNTAESVDRAARAVVNDAGFGDYFIHRTGHGLGLDIHEEPYLVEGNELRLRAGMTFSVEPGVYLPGRFGVRIEDTVAVYADGPRRLNHATRRLQVVV